MSIARVLLILILAMLPMAARAQDEAPTDRGEYLARAGNCVACHSVRDGPAFAGGLKMGTPIGAIFTTNITPDRETGIGNYTVEEFGRALRHGIARDGHRLYPSMPYPSYAKLSDDDVKALYDYFMKSVAPVRQANQPTQIPWPLNMRWPLAVWDYLFAPPETYQPKPAHDAAWNRGAYLVQGLGHCGACHTPRGFAIQEKALDEGDSRYLTGAPLDNWSAPNLTGDTYAGIGRWSADDLFQYLKNGHNRFGTAFGTMIDVINNSTQYLTDDDLHAIVAYLKSLPPAPAQTPRSWKYDDATVAELRSPHPAQPGAVLFLQQCAACHVDDGNGHSPYLPPLAGNPAVLDGDPSSLINIVLNGSTRLVVAGMPDSYRMPQFRGLLTDQNIADVLSFVRSSWGNAAGAVAADKVAPIRKTTDPAAYEIVILKMR